MNISLKKNKTGTVGLAFSSKKLLELPLTFVAINFVIVPLDGKLKDH